MKWPGLTGSDTSSLSRGPSGNLIVNPGFESGSTAPSSWTAGNDADLDRHADPNSGTYCLEINENGTAYPFAYQERGVTTGEKYDFYFYVKAGTGTAWQAYLYDLQHSASLIDSGYSGTATSAYVQHKQYYTIPSGCTSIRIILQHLAAGSSGTTLLFDDIELRESTGYLTTTRDTPEGRYVCPKCYDGNHARNTPHKLRKKQPLRYPE